MPCQLAPLIPGRAQFSVNRFSQAEFAHTVAELAQLPPPNGAEVAFAGRSNAGKSSAINALTYRRRLAFVARRPGKTRTIQFYRLAPDRYLVDLPGYGYAQVPGSERVRWEKLLEHYLLERQTLVGLILIMDVRHPLTPLDEQLLRWILPRRLPIHILLTKTDKLSKATALAAKQELESVFKQRRLRCSVQLFSSSRRDGVEQAQAIIAEWLSLESDSPSIPLRHG